jgi:hypothetical protein
VEKKMAQHTNIKTSTVKYCGGSIMVWGCFAASGPGQLAIIDGKMNSEVYQDILQENVRLSLHQLKINGSWVMQQGNYPKHRKYAFWSGPVRVLTFILWNGLPYQRLLPSQ